MTPDRVATAARARGHELRSQQRGGLVALLRSNLGGGRDQPRAWLAFDARGGLVPTFAADRGLIGGAPVPFFALLGEQVFAAKEGEVIEFLTAFGLTRAEAAAVVRAVGTAP